MIALALCLAAFLFCLAMGRRALWLGVVATFAVGYSYGILRANIDQAAAHFIYDAGVAGLYLALMTQRHHFRGIQRYRLRPVMPWALCLIGWPTLLLLAPIQDPLVQLVGWRGQIFFVPFMMIGAIVHGDDMRRIGRWLGLLNLVALIFGLLEIKLGVPRFYPYNAVDQIIYRSQDVLYNGRYHFRIPATFVQSATYAGTMVASLPLLLGAVSLERKSSSSYFLMAMVGATAIGVFLAGSRSAAVLLFMMVGMITLSGRFKQISWGLWIAGIAMVGLLVSITPRMQRFFTLSNTHYVEQRVNGSVNEGIFELALDYPMGNGLGGGGTSLPYFLQSRVRNPVLMENEYARIMLEQGIPGLVIWIAFIAWVLTRRPLPRSDPWSIPQWIARLYCAISFATAAIGTGLLTAIPQSSFLMFFCGWIAAPQESLAYRMRRVPRAAIRQRPRPVRAVTPS